MLNIILAGVISVIISYLFGSCNSAIIVVRILKSEDIREHGSKSAGLTNTLRCYGKGPAVLTLIGDLAKGVIAVILSILIFKLFGFDVSDDFTRKCIGYIAGFSAIIGHVFPVYYGFKGGKGVLVSSSILIVIDPLTFGIIIPFFLVISLTTKYVSVGSISAAIFYPILTFILNFFVRHMPINQSLILTGLVILTSAVLIYMHRANISRLRAGTENKLFNKKKNDKESNDNG